MITARDSWQQHPEKQQPDAALTSNNQK